MKRWDELTKGERAKVIEKETNNTLKDIAVAGELFPELETEIAAAWSIAEGNRTPWFFPEILYHEITGAKGKIDTIALEFCETALYAESGEHCIKL